MAGLITGTWCGTNARKLSAMQHIARLPLLHGQNVLACAAVPGARE
jgi:hypothetical protein